MDQPDLRSYHNVAHHGLLALAAGPFTQAVAAIWPGERIADYFRATDTRRQVWHAWLAARLPLGAPAADEAGRLRDLLSSVRGRDLIADAYGAVPAGALTALAKFGPTARPVPAYRTLMRVLAEGGDGAKIVHHSETLPDDLIAALGELPPALRVTRLAVGLKSPGLASLIRWALVRAGERASDAIAEEAVTALVRRAPGEDNLFNEALDRLVSLCACREAFPAAPWPGTDRLWPVTTPERQRQVARRFRNCLEHRVSGVRRGESYYYVWEGGAEHAVVGLERVGRLGWCVTEVKGRGNERLGRDTLQGIADTFAPAPNIFAGWLDSAHAWWTAGKPGRDLALSGHVGRWTALDAEILEELNAAA